MFFNLFNQTPFTIDDFKMGYFGMVMVITIVILAAFIYTVPTPPLQLLHSTSEQLRHAISTGKPSNVHDISYRPPKYTLGDDNTVPPHTPAMSSTLTVATLEPVSEICSNIYDSVNTHQDEKDHSLLHDILHFSMVSYIVGFLGILPLYITSNFTQTTILPEIIVALCGVLIVAFNLWRYLQAVDLKLQILTKELDTKRDSFQHNLDTKNLEVDSELATFYREYAIKLEVSSFQEKLKEWLRDELKETRPGLGGSRVQEGQSDASKTSSDSECTTCNDDGFSSTCPTSCDEGSSSDHERGQTEREDRLLYSGKDQAKLVAQWVGSSQRAKMTPEELEKAQRLRRGRVEMRIRA